VASVVERNEKSRNRRQYSAAERAEILRDAEALGGSEAGRKHGVPKSTISRWRSARLAPEQTPEIAAAASVPIVDETPRARVAIEGVRAEAPLKKRRAVKRYTPSQKSEALEYAAQHGVSAAHQKLGISRYTIYAWQHRQAKAAKGEGPSPTSGPAPSEIEERRDREILAEWKLHPGLGPSQVRNQLRRRSIKVAVQTVRRVMEDAGYRPPKVNREPHDKRFEAVRPNHLWHLDFVQRFINRASTFTLIVIDDYSRFVVGHGVDDAERADIVIATFEEAVQRHGKPERVIHDKGSAFWSWRGISRFTSLLTELGIDQIEAVDKEWNGKLEAFNGNLHTELFDVQRFFDSAEMRRRLATHLHWYNHGRTHQGLGGLLVPADRFYGRAAEVLAAIEAGAGRDMGDGLNLRDRILELFKVTCKGGVTEVWLMGQPLLGAKPKS
jgi:transposase InsO family protein